MLGGTFLAAAVTPLATAPHANADILHSIIDPVMNAVGHASTRRRGTGVCSAVASGWVLTQPR